MKVEGSDGSKAIRLGDGYYAETDKVSREKWDELIEQFADANIYQTWSYDAIRCGEKDISHLVLNVAGEPVAGAQSRIIRAPVMKLGVAYIRWGPFWVRRGQSPDATVFRMAIRALRNEYVCRRRLVLRIFPLLYGEEASIYREMLHQERFKEVSRERRPRTLVIDLTPPLEEIRKKIDQKWRNCLNKAERGGLDIIEGTDDSMFEGFIALYKDLLRRKKFTVPNDINEFMMIQRDLPTRSKMRVFLCRSGQENTAGAICSSIGDEGLYLFGATNVEGMKNNGSYLVQWNAIKWMKAMGCRSYNLNGINPAENPGTYHFKAGLSGKNGRDTYYLGRYDCNPDKLRSGLLRALDRILPFLKRT